MAELADAPDSKSGSFGSEGSTPSLGTTQVLDKKHFKETVLDKKFLSNSCQDKPILVGNLRVGLRFENVTL